MKMGFVAEVMNNMGCDEESSERELPERESVKTKLPLLKLKNLSQMQRERERER